MNNIMIYPYKVQHFPKGKPITFVANHSNVHDVPVLVRIIKKHVYLLAGSEHRGVINGIAFSANGVVWVKRDDKMSRYTSKQKLLFLLKRKKNILMFPEGTWNLSKNLPMLQIHRKIIELAQVTHTPIVPITLEYTCKKSVFYSIGKAIYFNETDDKLQSIQFLRDTMATMRWEFGSNNCEIKKKDISNKEYSAYTQERLNEYPKLNVEFEKIPF